MLVVAEHVHHHIVVWQATACSYDHSVVIWDSHPHDCEDNRHEHDAVLRAALHARIETAFASDEDHPPKEESKSSLGSSRYRMTAPDKVAVERYWFQHLAKFKTPPTRAHVKHVMVECLKAKDLLDQRGSDEGILTHCKDKLIKVYGLSMILEVLSGMEAMNGLVAI